MAEKENARATLAQALCANQTVARFRRPIFSSPGRTRTRPVFRGENRDANRSSAKTVHSKELTELLAQLPAEILLEALRDRLSKRDAEQ
jgi:hypothetical protein